MSKEYNFGETGFPYKPGRFIIGNLREGYPDSDDSVQIILAEEPAGAYTRPGFNVEVHYLQIRKHAQMGKI